MILEVDPVPALLLQSLSTGGTRFSLLKLLPLDRLACSVTERPVLKQQHCYAAFNAQPLSHASGNSGQQQPELVVACVSFVDVISNMRNRLAMIGEFVVERFSLIIGVDIPNRVSEAGLGLLGTEALWVLRGLGDGCWLTPPLKNYRLMTFSNQTTTSNLSTNRRMLYIN